MLDESGVLSLGCLAFIVDTFSSLPIIAQGAHAGRDGDYLGVSQSMQFLFHAPARLYALLFPSSPLPLPSSSAPFI